MRRAVLVAKAVQCLLVVGNLTGFKRQDWYFQRERIQDNRQGLLLLHMRLSAHAVMAGDLATTREFLVETRYPVRAHSGSQYLKPMRFIYVTRAPQDGYLLGLVAVGNPPIETVGHEGLVDPSHTSYLSFAHL